MSNIKTDFALFDVEDYKGEAKLSSYNLSITPLTFKARIPNNESRSVPLNDQKVTFDFGDGTFANNLTSAHIFEYPGQYTVRMILRDCDNNAILASYSDTITIHDYVTNTFTVDLQTLNLNLSAGEFSTPITITSNTPFYQDFQDIYYSISGCQYHNFFNLSKDAYNHLKNYFSIYDKNYITAVSGWEYVELDKISLSSTNIYARLSTNGTETVIVNGLSSSLSSVHVGASGLKEIYVKTEEQFNPLNISFFKDRNNIFSNSLKGYRNNNYTNNFNVTLSTAVGATSGQVLSCVRISSNGLVSEGDEINSFKVSDVQYKGLEMPFTLSPAGSAGPGSGSTLSGFKFTMKALSGGNPSFVLLSGTSPALGPDISGAPVLSKYYTISSLYNTLSYIDTKFWYRGVFTFNDQLSTTAPVLTLSASVPYASGPTDYGTVSGHTTFTCYPKDYYGLYKHNENFDFEQTIKDLRFQEILIDKDIFFSDFIGSIFGDVSSNYDVIGKKLYEKIFNFVSNNADIDYCDINSLINMSNMVGDDGIVFDRAQAQEPTQVKRFLNTLSVNYNKFRGGKNKFEENFDPKGTANKEIYGKNLGPEVNSLTYEITAGTDLVAYELFSNTYKRLNTYQPLSALSGVNTGGGARNANTYMLSDFSTEVTNASLSGAGSWGWGLSLPNSYTIETVNTFYEFYSLSAVYDDTILSGLIDYENGLTTVNFNEPLSALQGEGNIFDIMIRNSLFSSLSLF
jgi:hypothetical protein